MSDSPPDSSFAASKVQHGSSSPSRNDSSVLSQDLPAGANESFESELSVEKHPKGKRKRTAAKDKMILEDAYKANPKPDKQARLDIVNRVSLNEKEVQIWFQNRRQNDRRKSRPLSPQELAALRFNGLHGVSADAMAAVAVAASAEVPVDVATHAPAIPRPASPSQPAAEPVRSATSQITATPRPSGTGHSQLPETTPQNRNASSQSSQDGPPSMTHTYSSGSVGYLANRWNIGGSFSTPAGQTGQTRDADDSPSLFGQSTCTSDTTHKARQRQSQSNVRLSWSLEGKAELVANASSPTRPSPRKDTDLQQLPRQRGLKRCYSALPTVTLPPISTLTNLLPPRLARGRSRDVQAWQSCANSETRDELTAHAEHESNGSAVAAISLLRSTSGVLQPSNSKRNTPVSTPRDTHFAKKAKLSRTTSSVGRLEHLGKENEVGFAKTDGKVQVSMLVSPTDSDKENWSPDEDGNAANAGSRRPLPALESKPKNNARRVGRGVLQSRSPGMLGGHRANTAPSRPRGMKDSVDIFEDEATRVSRDADVEKFMRGEVSPSKKPDMDCVAGLLSLSQGAWR